MSEHVLKQRPTVVSQSPVEPEVESKPARMKRLVEARKVRERELCLLEKFWMLPTAERTELAVQPHAVLIDILQKRFPISVQTEADNLAKRMTAFELEQQFAGYGKVGRYFLMNYFTAFRDRYVEICENKDAVSTWFQQWSKFLKAETTRLHVKNKKVPRIVWTADKLEEMMNLLIDQIPVSE